MTNSPPENGKPPTGEDQGAESVSRVNVTFPAESASQFSPDLLVIAGIVQRARRYAPTPPAMVVFSDGHEEVL